jgi:VWFA-related protein
MGSGEHHTAWPDRVRRRLYAARGLLAPPVVACVIVVTLAAVLAAQDATPPPTFRSGVDVITMDIVAIDKQGKPVEDLRPADFAVKVDGRSRPVVSAQLVKADVARAAVPSSNGSGPLVSSNVGGQAGRRVVIAVDQTLIAPGSITPVMRSASNFVDALAPADYAALLAFPEPGPRVDFTTDKARVRAAIQNVVGQAAKVHSNLFDLSIDEVQRIDKNERLNGVDPLARTFDQVWGTLGPAMRRVLTRGCRSLTLDELMMIEHASDLLQCIRDLGNQAMVEAQEMRMDAKMSLQRLESYLRELARLDGPKSVILVSAGLVAEDAALQDIGRLAAEARATIHVVAVDRERERDRTDLANGQSQLKLNDRSIELHALETIADQTGGGLWHAIGPAQGVFDRLAAELSASYVVAVERRNGDPERQRIEIEVKRRGITVRSPHTVMTAAPNTRRSPQDLLSEALASPLPVSGLPLGLATFVRRDPAGAYRLNVAAQIGQPGAASAEFDVGYAVLDRQDRIVTSRADHVQLSASGRSSEPLQYDASIDLQPGAYSLRVAVVDGAGRRGTAIRRVELPELAGGTLSTSDLIVGTAGEGQTLHPSVEPHVDGRLTAFLELYPPAGDRSSPTVTMEIAEGDAAPALTTTRLNLAATGRPEVWVAQGTMDVNLVAGRYVARATVRRDGTVIQTVARAFVLDNRAAGATLSATAAAPAAPAPLSADVRARTAGYVHAFVHGLANVVGQEDFELSGPSRRVTSDFLLVQHPASPGDLLTYRDVTQVNGTPVPDRQQRLEDLFLKPAALAGDKVRQITLAAAQQVPPVLNPIFVLAFLQSDLQPRFELTVIDAGPDWPQEVKAVRFVEVARPTILRGGMQGELDVPVRGTAWLEPGTGRVLQTELIVPSGKSTTTVVTKFTLDPRLQIMVPEQMRTENPKGVATYSNFRRFSVQTDTAVAPPPVP